MGQSNNRFKIKENFTEKDNWNVFSFSICMTNPSIQKCDAVRDLEN